MDSGWPDKAMISEPLEDSYHEVQQFLNNEYDMTHFACHAVFTDESRAESYLKLSDEFRLRFEDMDTFGFQLKGQPLVVLNACATGNLDPLYTSHFAAKLLKATQRGVVATECRIPDAFGADFTEHLYQHYLLSEKQLGQGLLESRRYFLEERGNPTGLAYAMYAPPETQLIGIQLERDQSER